MNTRRRITTILTAGVVAAAIVFAAPRQVSAASLTHVETVEVSNNESVFKVSVFPGKAGYDSGTVSGVFGNGTVADYRFFAANSDVVWSYADGGAGVVAPVPSPPAGNVWGPTGQSQNWPDVWTITDPGVNFANAADFTTNTQAAAQNIRGTIDISRISKGTLYFIYGSYQDINTIALTMSGPGQPDLVASHTEDPPLINKGWISSFDISDAGAYDTVTYTYTNNDADGSRARFMGVIVCTADPMNPYPPDGARISPGDVELSWTNLPAVGDANDVWVDVWFGTDPNDTTGVNFKKVVAANIDGMNRTSVTVDASVLGTTYYWQVNSYLNGSPTGDPNEGQVYTFIASDLPPSAVDAGDDMITWSGRPVQLAATVVDDGLSPLTYLWTVSAPDGIAVELDPATADTADPTVTLTKVPASVIAVGDPSFEDHILAEGGYVDIAAAAYTGPWESVSVDAWIDYGYWRADGYPEDLYARTGNNKMYPYNDSVYQILDATFIEGATYTLSVWTGEPWAGDTIDWRLYFTTEDHTAHMAEVSGTAGLTWEQVSLTYTATAADAGKKIGIKIWATDDVSFDDVQLTVDPPVAPPALASIELTLAVRDEANPTPLTDTVTIDVYDDACKAAIGAGLDPIEPTDLDGNCVTNLTDFAAMALKWLDEYALAEPVAKP